MSGFADAGGQQKWMQQSGGTPEQYKQQMAAWQGPSGGVLNNLAGKVAGAFGGGFGR